MNIDAVDRRSPLPALRAAPAGEQVSVAGVVLLSALAVALTIVGVLLLGAVLLGIWWLVSHIPVPPFVWRLLSHLRLNG